MFVKMFFNKSFLTITTIASFFITTLHTAEESIARQSPTIPSLAEICRRAFVTETRESTDITHALTQLELALTNSHHPLHGMLYDEHQFYDLMTAKDKEQGYTLLHHAVIKGIDGVAKLLKICTQQENHFNAIRKTKGYSEPYPSLLHDFELKNNKRAITPLDRAIAYEKFDVADILIKKGASLDTKCIIFLKFPAHSFIYASPLANAIKQGNLEGIKYLLEQGVSIPNSRAGIGQYVSTEDVAVIDALIQRQWTLVSAEEQELPQSKGHAVLLSPHSINALSMFIGIRSDIPSATKIKIMTALLNQCRTPQEHHALLHQGFAESVQYDNIDTLQAVLQSAPHGIITHYPFALIDVLRRQLPHYTNMAILLINNGAILDTTDADGNTSLHVAVSQQNFPIVRGLIRKGAHLNSINHSDETPLDVIKNTSRTPERTDIRHYLLSNGALTARQVRHRTLREANF